MASIWGRCCCLSAPAKKTFPVIGTFFSYLRLLRMQRIQILFEKYLNNQISPDEFSELWQLMDEKRISGELSPQLQELWEQAPYYSLPPDEWEQKMQQRQLAQLPVRRRKFNWRPYAVAASLLMVIASYWVITSTFSGKEIKDDHTRNLAEVQPGHNGAVLTLSNGKQLVLDSAGNGALAIDANVAIIKKDGELVYNGNTAEVVYNTISTDNGRQWRLVLPDGTKVWLNAASSIRYPLNFIGNERLVEMTGEAYFEVVHNGQKPFRVKVGDRMIEDIGTSFNINSYTDEADMKTTLLEGAVSIFTPAAAAPVLVSKPGQQAQVTSSGKIRLKEEADLDEVMAWKNGMFSFNQSDIESIMRQIGRWYDLSVVYKGTKSRETFSGMVSRNSNLVQVLKIMEQASIKFRLEGKTLIVIQ
jgi:transmembrane sensor